MSFVGFAETTVRASASGEEVAVVTDYDRESGAIVVTLPETPVNEEIRITFAAAGVAGNEVEREAFTLLDRAQIAFQLKERIFRVVKEASAPAAALASLASMELDESLYGALCELLTARL
ncbi:hypothetical protein D1872_262570 [compost metagenome]